jgi:hypothetical protein
MGCEFFDSNPQSLENLDRITLKLAILSNS